MTTLIAATAALLTTTTGCQSSPGPGPGPSSPHAASNPATAKAGPTAVAAPPPSPPTSVDLNPGLSLFTAVRSTENKMREEPSFAKRRDTFLRLRDYFNARVEFLKARGADRRQINQVLYQQVAVETFSRLQNETTLKNDCLKERDSLLFGYTSGSGNDGSLPQDAQQALRLLASLCGMPEINDVMDNASTP